MLDARVPALDQAALRQELGAETWTEQSLLVKVLRQFGAKDLVVAEAGDDGGGRDVDFSLPDLGIPWGKVAAFMGREATGLQPQALADVKSHSEVTLLPDNGVILESEFLLEHLALGMTFRIVVRSGKFSFAAGVRKLSKGSILDNAVIWRFMRAGFMGAAKRFGQALLSELQSHARGRSAAGAPLLASLGL